MAKFIAFVVDAAYKGQGFPASQFGGLPVGGQFVEIDTGTGGALPAAPINSVQINEDGLNFGSLVPGAGGDVLMGDANVPGASRFNPSLNWEELPAQSTLHLLGNGGVSTRVRLEPNGVARAEMAWDSATNEAIFGGVGTGLLAFRNLGIKWKWAAADGTPGQVLGTNGAGQLGFVSVSGGGIFASALTQPLATLTTQNIPWSGAGGGDGNLYLSAVWIPAASAPLTLMTCGVTQAPGGAGGVAMGIYSAAGVRLAYTAINAPVVGPGNTFPMVSGSPISLTPNTLYYFAFYCNQNGVRAIGGQGITGTPGLQPMGFSVPNSQTQPGAVNGMPANVSAFFGNQSAERYWVSTS